MFTDSAFSGLQAFGKTENNPVAQECIDILSHLLCTQSSPPCNPDSGLLMLICEDDCRLYNRVKEQGFCSEIDERARALLSHFMLAVELFKNFDCFDPTTYYHMNVTNPDPDICTGLFSPEVRGELYNKYIVEPLAKDSLRKGQP